MAKAVQRKVSTNLPQFVLNILMKKFTEEQVKTIDKNWNTFSQMSLSNSCAFEFILQGQSILALCK